MRAQVMNELQQLTPKAPAALELQHVVDADRQQDRVESLRRQRRDDVTANAPRTGADHAGCVPVDLPREASRHEARNVPNRRLLDAARTHTRDDRVADGEEMQWFAASDAPCRGTDGGRQLQRMAPQCERLRKIYGEQRIDDEPADDLASELCGR